jgi:anaerobic magnesium-protoporphyrin IX monomethyl ester cyclase
MRVLFVQDNGINESLALAELSARLMRDGHETRLLLAREERSLTRAALNYTPGLIILPCNVFASRFVLKTAGVLKTVLPDVPILVGGTHPTFAPDLIRHHTIDLQLVGEADVAVPALVEQLSRGLPPEVQGIWTRTGSDVVERGVALRPEVMDDLPLPDRELYHRYPFMRRFPWKKFTTGRGCENRCAFCYNEFVRRLYGGKRFVRRKSPARVVEEVKGVGRASVLRWVHFADDLFVTDTDWLEEFAQRYRSAIGLPFSCNSSADRMTPAIARTLARAGCRYVAMGVETADEQQRVQLMKKPATDAVLKSAADAVRAAGMELVTFVMVALPGEIPEQALATLRFNQALGADATRIMMAVPLPGTRMAREAAENGHLDRSLANDFSGGLDVNLNPFGPYYDVVAPAWFENLVNLAPLVNHLPDMLVNPLLHRVPRTLSRPVRIWMSLQEKRLAGFSLLEGIRFFRHTGNPMNRTTNYVTLI